MTDKVFTPSVREFRQNLKWYIDTINTDNSVIALKRHHDTVAFIVSPETFKELYGKQQGTGESNS